MTAYNVTSSFIDQMQTKQPTLVRKFLIGTSDYTAYVANGGWPRIKREWNSVAPKSASVTLANQEQTFNFFRADPTLLTKTCTLQVGVAFTVASYEFVNIFTGTVGRVDYEGARLRLSIIDKLKSFGERVVGNSVVPVDFLNSNYLPSDIAWIVATCYGGFDNTQSTANVDIDYNAFLAWASVFSEDSVYVNARYDGAKVNSIMRSMGRMTGSSIFEENGKLTFARFDFSSTDPFSLSANAIVRVNVSIDDEKIVNRQIVNAGYEVNSRAYTIVVNDESTASVNSYGIREEVEEDGKLWYVSSANAANFAQRVVSVYGDPYEDFSVETAMQPLGQSLGNIISITYPFLGIAGDSFRLMSYEYDMNKSSFRFTANTSQLFTFFRLDHASLGLLDQSYNPLG